MTPTDTPDRVAQIVAWLRRDARWRINGEKVFANEMLHRLADAIEAGEPFKDSQT